MTSKTNPTSKEVGNKKKTIWQILMAIAMIVALFSAASFLEKNKALALLGNEGYNDFYQQMPSELIGFINKNPLDKVVDRNEARAKKNKTLKYNGYILENGYSRELVVIKKLQNNDTTQLRPISFNIYPKNKALSAKGKDFFKLITNAITYRYNGHNYRVAKQVLPNIGIIKIEPYSKYWKTTISYVDDGLLALDEVDKGIKMNKKDSLSLGLNIEGSAYDFLFSKQLEAKKILFLPKHQQLKKLDFKNASPAFQEYVKEHGLQLMKTPNDIVFWQKITQEKKMGELQFFNADLVKINQRLKEYFNGDRKFSELFDEQKLASYYALLNLYSNRTDNELYLHFNKSTQLLEPFVVDKELGILNTYVKDLKLKEADFSKNYAQESRALATLNELKELIYDHKSEIREKLEILHSVFPTHIFDEALFHHNKLIIEKSLRPSSMAKIALVHYDDAKIEVSIENLTNFPLEVIELSHKGKKRIVSPKNSEAIPIGSTETIVFELPDSFKNLFVHKKKKTTGFIFEKDIFDLRVGYRLLGTSTIFYDKIVPFRDVDALQANQDLFRSSSNLEEFPFLLVSERYKTISFKSDSVVIDKPLVLPAGYRLFAKEGLHINILEGGKLISRSALNFVGAKKHPVVIYSSDKKGQGIFVMKAERTSILKNVEFRDLGNPDHGLWSISGAVTFYESDVNLDGVLIADNRCEDGLNIIRSDFNMVNTTFLNIQSDAFDGDFVMGKLTNCTFENLGNDAIDVSGSSLHLSRVKINNAGDKGISVGEDSKVFADNIEIKSSEIAIAGKDLSTFNGNRIDISDCKLAFTAFKKKPEFGPSKITAKNVVLKNIQTQHLIENGSSLILNGVESKTVAAVKDKMYGVEFGVDSKETRTIEQ
ncbi:hypothetical protein MNBD_BACTEROID03-1953 [hydrothermal vent metagenome]|uniref:Right handed beta helix domain-containing protein n=1 Tax=hydrothermal vent metagenome TaxID=652676 RepID=A0A3B0TVX1_9ZZZZ